MIIVTENVYVFPQIERFFCKQYVYIESENFFLIGIHAMQGWTATTRHGVTRKRSTKRLKHTGNLSRKNLQLIDLKPFRS